jgi:phosphoribosyl-AMP cyclohydrolase
VLLKVKQIGAACHEGYYSCFFRKISDKDGFKLEIVKKKVFTPEKVYGDK